MSDVTVRVRGADQLARTLRKAGADLQDMKQANERVGSLVASQARSNAPKRTGRLAGSIRPARQARKVVIRTGPYRYAWVQEFGSPRRGISPKAYMRNAAQQKRPEVEAAYFREMEQIVGRIHGE